MEIKHSIQKKAIIIGSATAIFWSLQHPLQHPLYKLSGGGFLETLTCLALSEIIAITISLLILMHPVTRKGIPLVINNKFSIFKMLIPVFIGFSALLLYAIAQPKINNAQLSVILAASPAGFLLYSFVLSNLEKEKQKSPIKLYLLHAWLFLTVLICTIWLSGFNWIMENYVFSLAALMVPCLYYLSGFIVIRWFVGDPKDFDENTRFSKMLAAASLVSILGGSIFLISTLIYIKINNYNFEINFIKFNEATMFIFGGLSASIAGIIYYYNITQPMHIRDNSSTIYHLTPGFTILFSFLLGWLLNLPIILPLGSSVLSGLIIVVSLIIYYRKEFSNLF